MLARRHSLFVVVVVVALPARDYQVVRVIKLDCKLRSSVLIKRIFSEQAPLAVIILQDHICITGHFLLKWIASVEHSRGRHGRGRRIDRLAVALR